MFWTLMTSLSGSPALAMTVLLVRKKLASRDNALLVDEMTAMVHRHRQLADTVERLQMALEDRRSPSARPALPIAPAPAQERADAFWLDVVGVPFELWCAMAIRCHGPNGFELGPQRLAYLTGRRDTGEFTEAPVNLTKPVKAKPVDEFEETLRYHEEQLRAATLVLPPDTADLFFDGAHWAAAHQSHGVEWQRKQVGADEDELLGACSCGDCYVYSFKYLSGRVEQPSRSMLEGPWRRPGVRYS